MRFFPKLCVYIMYSLITSLSCLYRKMRMDYMSLMEVYHPEREAKLVLTTSVEEKRGKGNYTKSNRKRTGHGEETCRQ